jgi:hypothetical protein
MPLWLAGLVLFFSMIFVFGTSFVAIVAVVSLHDAFNPSSLWPETSTPAKVLMLMASLCGAVVPGLVLANLALWAIPGARRALAHRSTSEAPRAFLQATVWLFRLAAALLPLALVLSVLGAVDPWIG